MADGRLARFAAALLALSLLVGACGDDGDSGGTGPAVTTPTVDAPGLPFTYTGPDGVETTVTDVSRIVTLSGEFSEIVYELGLADNLVGVDLSSVYPRDVMRTKAKIGVERVLLPEPIIATEPTVVLGDVDAFPPEVIDQVRGAGIPVIILPRYEGVDAPGAKIRAVGEVLGIPERGEELAARVDAEIAEVLALTSGLEDRPRLVVLYATSGAQTLLLLGENTVAEGLADAVGAIDVAPPAGEDGMLALTPEALAAGQPDVIITAERGLNSIGGIEAFLELPGVAQTPAGINQRILVFEDLYLLGLGPRTGALLREIALELHPDLGP
ncbi:ABC transporter substrate-binding protein [bacterium]|nr:ABC transporter substrate-binding protein [bacterium]